MFIHMNINISIFPLKLSSSTFLSKEADQQQKLSQSFAQTTHDRTAAVISTQINSAYE